MVSPISASALLLPTPSGLRQSQPRNPLTDAMRAGEPAATPSSDGARPGTDPAAPASPQQAENRPAASADNQRREVDRRVSDGGDVRVTVVSYSDGSSETLQEIRAAAPATPKPTMFGKGMLVDAVA